MTQDSKAQGPYGRLIPLSKWPNYHIWPTIPGLRRLIIHQHENGFNIAVRKVGKLILIDENSFFEWVKTRSEDDKVKSAQ